jgi:hypothetical protein
MNMSILIEGMEMPKDGVYWCEIGVAGDIATITIHGEERKSFPLVSIPEPHGRLGDLDRLEQMFADIDNAPYSGFDGTEPFYSAEDAAQIIRLAPTIIPASEKEKLNDNS